MNKNDETGERIAHSCPGSRGKPPRCHDCKRIKSKCRCEVFANGPGK